MTKTEKEAQTDFLVESQIQREKSGPDYDELCQHDEIPNFYFF